MNNAGDHKITEPSISGNGYNVSSDGVPLQRPPRVAGFKNRSAELSRLLTLLQPGNVVSLWGMGGDGKTALAAEATWRQAPENEPPAQFPDGIIYHSFYNQPQANMLFETIARAFGHEFIPTPRQAAQNALAVKCALLVLDDVDALKDADKELRTILQAKGKFGVLFISRSPKYSEFLTEQLELKPFEEDDAFELFKIWFSPQSADDATARQICNLVGRLPLAVRLAGCYLKKTGETVTDYLSWLTQTPLETFDLEKRRSESVDELLACSLEQVRESARQVVEILGRMALAPINANVLATALNKSEDDLQQALDELTEYGILSRRKELYEISHAMIHTYARKKTTLPSKAMANLAVYYTQFISEQCLKVADECARSASEREHIMQVFSVCVDSSQWEAGYPLAWVLKDYLNNSGRITEEIIVDQTALTLASQMEDRREESAWLCHLGVAFRTLGEFGKAIDYHEQALTIDMKISNRKAVADNWGHIGIIYRLSGEFDKSIDYLNKALLMDRKIEYQQGEADNLYHLGLVYLASEAFDKAVRHFMKALEIHRDFGNRQGEADDLRHLGITYRMSEEMEKAIECHQQALALDTEIGNRRGVAGNLFNLGIASRILDKPDEAIDYHQQSFVITRKIGDRQGEVDNLGNLGIVYQTIGESDNAVKYFQLALMIAREIGYRRGEAENLSNLGKISQASGDLDQAIKYLQGALEIFTEIRSPDADKIRKRLSELRS